MSGRDLTGSHDFDFLHGSWRITCRRLLARLAGSDEWETFAADGTCRPILGGLGNIDDLRPLGDDLGGYEGATMRLFDPETGLWSIYWADTIRCRLFPPTVGRFDGATGVFFGDETDDGRPVRVRFIWSEITATTASWKQAFSADGGESWETNFTMDFVRTA